MAIAITWDHQNPTVTYSGYLTKDDIISAITEILSQYIFEKNSYQINDLSAVTETNLTPIDLNIFGAMNRNAAKWNPEIRIAFILNDELKKMASSYTDIVTETSWDLAYFDSLAQAQEWVKH